jgi:hypothetical protein
MTVLDKLQIELANVDYFSQETYERVLAKHSLRATEEYAGGDMKENVYKAALDILQDAKKELEIFVKESRGFSSMNGEKDVLERKILRISKRIG